MSLIDKIVSSDLNEIAIRKQLDNYSYNANKKKPTLSTVRAKIPKYSKSSLLGKIVSESENESKIRQQLDQKSYAAINGQRQEVKNNAPEGVTMLGQLNREKPLDAITKEMIQEYQAEELKPVMVDGEARKYEKASYEPQFSASFDELQPINYYDERIQNINIKKEAYISPPNQ